MNHAVARPSSRLLPLALSLVLIAGQASASAPQAPARGTADAADLAPIGGPAPIAAGLLARLDGAGSGRFVVEFAAEADLGPAAAVEGRAARGRAVVDRLRGTAEAAQAATRDLVNRTARSRFEGFWLRNVAVVTGSAQLARRIAALPGVSAVREERTYNLVEPVATGPGDASERPWGIDTIGAPAAWDQGVLGAGVTIANIDSGVDFAHPALVGSYRGNLGAAGFEHDYAWWDPTGLCGPIPCDTTGHGTHTMGTMVGGDGPGPLTPDIGVAPGATWIAAKGCEERGCSESALLSSGQWILAPTRVDGSDPDPARRPDIVNNSWSGTPGDPFYEDVVAAWRAAGIVPVFSAGNRGPACNTVASPGDYAASLTVGATDPFDGIAEFSSRGPSVYDVGKPDLAAPGVDVVSSVPGGGYQAFSGTSMAAPHVAAALALVLSASGAAVADFDALREVLATTALDLSDGTCGSNDDDTDNVYGAGRLDAAAAVGLVATGGTLAGTVSGPEGALPGARVTVEGERVYTATTDADGRYRLLLPAATYALSAEAFGHAPARLDSVTVGAGETLTADLVLEALPTATLRGTATAAEDGAPLPGVGVRPIGVPIDGVTTGDDGTYAIELPIGSYLLLITAGGCTEPVYAEVELLADTTHDASVTRRLDAAGHGCRPIDPEWVDAQLQTGLIGDNWAGRLRLPFDVPFYGDAYGEIFVNPNGFLNFLEADPYHDLPGTLPDAGAPNAAIYYLWRNMQVGDAGTIDYDVVGEAPNRAFVLEFDDISVNDQPGFLDAEVKLWESGTIDLLYGASGEGLADGGSAVVGIENAAGDDALQIAAFEPLLAPHTAYRIEAVPTALVSGVVTAANDGLPIAGARVTAMPGGRVAVTDPQGRYVLRLLAGTYDLGIEANGYDPAAAAVVAAAGTEQVLNVSLTSPIASVTPSAVDLVADLETPATTTLTVRNDGTGTLDFEVRESDGGGTLPELPPAASVEWRSGWRPAATSAEVIASTDAVPSESLLPVVDDPAGDAISTVDILGVRGAGDADEITIEMDLADASQADVANGFVYLDLDQDPTTGYPPSIHNGLPTQDIGFEVYVELWHYEPSVLSGSLINPFSGESWPVPVRVEGATIAFDLPRAGMSGDDGWVDVALVMGDQFGASDWAPEVGHGSVETYADAAWLNVDPASASVAPGETVALTVSAGGPGVVAGDYTGEIVLLTDDPVQPRLRVTTTLRVGLPDDFGRVEGRVSDAHTEAGLPAQVVVHAERDGVPFDVAVTAGDDGDFVLLAPAGTWPAKITHPGYVVSEPTIDVVAGATREGVDIGLHRIQPHATVEGGPFEIQLLAGETETLSVVVGNVDGHAPLAVDLYERPVATAQPAGASTVDPALGADAAPDGWTLDEVAPSVEGNPVLVVMGHLPWDSDALLQVLGANGLAYDIVGADQLGETDLGAYRLVIVASDQTGSFYDALASHADRLAAYVRHGGFLWFSASAWGFAGGSLDGAVLPGGVTISGPVFEFYNVVTEPSHPMVQGIPNPVFGDFASSAVFGSVPEAATVILRGQATGEPTLIEYPHGAGRVLTGSQPLEFAWMVGWELGFLLENGVPYAAGVETVGDVPWLTLDPTTAIVAEGETMTLDLDLDAAGMGPGRYRADVVIVTDDPQLPAAVVPITLVVPAYAQAVNAGGGAVTGADGTSYAADRAYGGGGFGHVGASSTRSTRGAIEGTEDDARFADLRLGMTSYRFDVPNGTYRVALDFAELAVRRAGGRVFGVRIEGERVIAGLDLVVEAGFATAYTRTFEVVVDDGRLDIDFEAMRGDRPILNAISVTHMP